MKYIFASLAVIVLVCVFIVVMPCIKKSKLGNIVFLFKKYFIDRKSYCKYCIYSVYIDENYYCVKKGVKKDLYYDIEIIPKECKIENKDNSCRDFEIDITKL